jgi:hypothetical protein
MRFVVLVFLVGCQYGPSFRDCDIACSAATSCPDGFTCGPEGYCRTSGGNPMSCDAVRDARPDIDAPAGTHYCAGAPAQCETVTDMGACGTQMGCSWTTPTCSFSDNCANHLPNTDCDGTPGCQTYVVQPYCRYISGYCGGSTKAMCEAKQNCAFGGGCMGAAKPCGQLSSQTTCQAQVGCTWK